MGTNSSQPSKPAQSVTVTTAAKPPSAPNMIQTRTALQTNADNLRTAGKNAEAIVEYGKVIKLDPNFAYGYAGKGLSLFNLGRYQEALVEFDKASIADNTVDWFYGSKGGCLHGLVDTKKPLLNATVPLL
jgi:tetratricopeptide (TPR) repeat protein